MELISNIPMVHEQLNLIKELQTEEYWQDVTVTQMESVRRHLRALIKLIEKRKWTPVYTNFEDELQASTEVELRGFGGSETYERYQAKARAFLREHFNHVSVERLRQNVPLTPMDLEELDRMFEEAGLKGSEFYEQALNENQGLGLFVRSLVGLDREAAKKALGQFALEQQLSANQIEFVNLIVDHLTEHGVMDASLLSESPFIDIHDQGPDGLFESKDLDNLIHLLEHVRESAEA